MTKLKIVSNVSDFTAIVAGYEADAASSVSDIKELTAKKNGAKINAYAHLIAGLITHKVRKGTKQAGEIKASLIECGVSKACAKRYLENGQKAKALAWVKAAGSDADAILQAFADNDVKTEQDLVNIVCPKPVLTAAEELAAKAQALTDADDDAVQALIDAAAIIGVEVTVC
jgi:TusA-related sulfurtransferase